MNKLDRNYFLPLGVTVAMVLAGAIPLTGCGSREYQGELSPTYSEISRVIIQPRCVQCHASLATYEGVASIVRAGNASASELYETVAEGSMPLRGLSLPSEEVTAIKTWIDAGAEEN